ncbi:hypothetical protein D3C72_1298950 [compost metagenome]
MAESASSAWMATRFLLTPLSLMIRMLWPVLMASTACAHSEARRASTPSLPHSSGYVMSSTAELNLPAVCSRMLRSLTMSAKSSTGCVTSRRSGGLTWLMSSRLGLGPMKDTRLITIASRIGSIGGLVTCANIWRK